MAPTACWAFPKGHPDEAGTRAADDLVEELTDVFLQGESDIDAAMRETVEESGVRVSQICEDVFCDVGYSFIKRLHADRWSKHPAYPDEARRPVLVTAPQTHFAQLQRFPLVSLHKYMHKGTLICCLGTHWRPAMIWLLPMWRVMAQKRAQLLNGRQWGKP